MPLFKVTFSRNVRQNCVIELKAENQAEAEEVAGLMDDPEDDAWMTVKTDGEITSVIECCAKCNTPYSKASIDGGRCLGYDEDGLCGRMICAVI